MRVGHIPGPVKLTQPFRDHIYLLFGTSRLRKSSAIVGLLPTAD
jgi:hypothetical protein